MAPNSDDAKPDQNSNEDDQDLMDDKFQALISGLSLDQSAPTDYLDSISGVTEIDSFTPPAPEKIHFRTSIKDGIAAFKRWRDNPSRDNTNLDDDGAQI